MTAAAVTVAVPATSANLGPGFDAFGLALGLYDEVTVRLYDEPHLSVEVLGEGADHLPRDETHLVVRALRAGLDRFGVSATGVDVRCANRIPQGRGLGSSAAAIVAGVLAAAVLRGDRAQAGPDLADVLTLASELEGHPDNVAACLLGGFTIAWTDGSGAHGVRLEASPAVQAVVFVPTDGLSTSTARGMLPATVPHGDAAHAAGRSALMVAALTSRPDLLLAATEDRLHQPYRAGSMASTAALVRRLRAAGVAAVVSGAGPSVLALVPGESRDDLSEVAEPGWTVTGLAIDRSGARVIDTAG